MSTELKVIKESGKEGSDLSVVKFYGGKDQGEMVQLTQGFGGCASMEARLTDEPGYIQLTLTDAYEVIIALSEWIKTTSEQRAAELQKLIDRDQMFKKTIVQDAVDCEKFIQDLSVLEIPVRLLKNVWS